MNTYAALYTKSNFSFLEGASHPDELVDQAKSYGLRSLAVCDRDGLYGMVRAHMRAEEVGQHLIVGAEVSVSNAPRFRAPPVAGEACSSSNAPRFRAPPVAGEACSSRAAPTPLVLLAQDHDGYRNLCRLLTKGRLRCQKGESAVSFEEVCQHAPGLILLWHEALAAEAEPAGGFLREAFGDRAYALLPRHRRADEVPRERRLRERAARFGLPLVAGSEVLYHSPQRRPLQDVLTCIRHGVTLDQAGTRLKPNAEHDLKSYRAMERLFADEPLALARTIEIAERCTFSLKEIRYRYPAESMPSGLSSSEWLRELTWRGARERYGSEVPEEAKAQIEKELALVQELDYGGYFLTMYEIVRFCRDQEILCQGRGSAANSIVCYCLGITAVDPVKMSLLFERFLSRERAEPPDIDLDIMHERREEVIQYVYSKYGRNRAAMVANLVRYRPRSAVRDVGKALGMAETTLDRAARVLDHYGGLPAEALTAAGLDSRIPQNELLLSLGGELLGFPRHLSIHPGGFLLGHEPVHDLVPIENATMEGRTVIQWDKYDLDYLGLMKVDVLALGMLSALKRCMDSTGYGDLAELPPDDAATYAMIQKADTIGVFQIESRAQMSMLGRLKPADFYDLVIEVAIVRPGPIVGQMVHPYLRRRQGLEEEVYEHPKLREILGRTKGVPLFQEQVMKIAVELGGFSPGESDELRRAIGAWRSDGRLEQIGARLLQGLLASGLSEGFCERLFAEIRGFADYGFPESHAASFALLVYASSYLKCHHPAEFAAALVNSQPLGFYSNHSLVDDAKRHGVEVLGVDLNASQWDCTLEGKALRLGLRIVSALNRTAAEALCLERRQRAFEGLEDVVQRGGLPLRVLQSLALGDAFAPWGWSQREALWRLLELQMLSRGARQGDLFGLLSAAEPQLGGFARLEPWKEVGKDYDAYGLSLRAHPMQALRAWAKEQGQALGWSAAQARALAHGSKGWAAGMVIVRQHPGTAKGVVFVTLEDETGLLDLVLWKDVYERYRTKDLQASFLRVYGVLQREGEAISMLIQRIQAIELPQEEPALAYQAHDWH